MQERGAGAVLAATDLRHPVIRPLAPLSANLGQVRFTRTWQIEESGWTAVARFTSGAPALLERRVERGTVLLFASDLDRRWNEFPLHASFAPFALEAARHLVAGADGLRDYVVGSAPASAQNRPGIHSGAPDGGRFTVNVDPAEGVRERITPEELAARFTPQPDTGSARPELRADRLEAAQGLWRYGLVGLLAVLVAESFAGRGKRHA